MIASASRIATLLALALLASCATVPVTPEAGAKLAPGEYEWHPEKAPAGPTLVVVSVDDQMAYIYRNGVQIGRTTVSTGREGKDTPTGVFTILEKKEEHVSSIYGSSMPYMQRLTWSGVALHAGALPGYPASAGCVRLPLEFSKLLFGTTASGTTVVITKSHTRPTQSSRPASVLLASEVESSVPRGPVTQDFWNPALSPSGPVAVLLSVTDQTIAVFRNGVLIGKSPVQFLPGPDRGFQSAVFLMLEGELKSNSPIVAGQKQRPWAVLSLDGAEMVSDPVAEVRARLRVPTDFGKKVAGLMHPGSLVVITKQGAPPETRTAPNFTVLAPGT